MDARAILDANKQKRMDELFQFLRFPSISARSEHNEDVKRCAIWLAEHMNQIGLKTEIMPTGGHPMVFGSRITSPEKLTVLYYGHYDVQPVEPLDLWKSPPFEPVIDNGFIMARGAVDDKGQLMTHLKAIEAYLASGQELPINVKMMMEGEEESGSANLTRFIEENAKLLKADIVVISDTGQFARGLPAVTYGLRGISFVEVKITGPRRDLHSGTFGGAVPNPINVLARMIASFHDSNGRIKIPGFYNAVRPITAWEKKQIKRLPFKKEKFLAEVGSRGLSGERGYGVLEQIWSRPTLDINGITGGYQGEGGKTIIPSWASCKITMRLVPNQDPTDICNKIEKYLKKICPKTVTMEITKHGGAPGVVVPTTGPWLKAAGTAIKSGFGVQPVYIKEGGSIPVVGTFKRVLGLDTLLLGWGQADDNAHSPNEHFAVSDFEGGCRSALALIDELAKVER